MRNCDKEKHHDFLQLMLNAKKKIVDEEEEDKNVELESYYGQNKEKEFSSYKSGLELTEIDIMATSFLFLVAGYETTASLLSYLFYLLAINPDIQNRLYNEIKSEDELNYETISKMPYLDACIAETLRLYNPVFEMSRLASQEYTLGIN